MLRFAITPGEVDSLDRANAAALIARCVSLAEDGVDFLLLREKKLAAVERLALARRVAARCGAMRVVVPGIAASEGFARHLRPGELPADNWTSVSCHTLDEVRLAAERGASAILFAPVFGKTVAGVEVVPGVGLQVLGEACAVAGTTPVFALGGVTGENTSACLQAGAAGVAGIRMFFSR